MIAAMSHRGSPVSIELEDRSAAFASLGAPEPVDRQSGSLHRTDELLVVAGARIDNRADLPEGSRVSGPDGGEAGLIAEIWMRSGAAGIARLAGDFTFAHWESARRRLVCGRDHMGVRPLYYHASAGRLVFATEIGALLALPDLPQTIDESRIVDYLGGMIDRAEATFFRAIRRLPPAHLLVADAGAIRLERYWDLDPEREIVLRSQDEYDEAFREHFTTAVACRFDGAGRTGSMLSGGLDSSSITAVARDLAVAEGRTLRTFSIIFPSHPRADESRYIQAMVESGGIDPTRIEGDGIAPRSGLGETLDRMHEPFDSPNLFLHNAIYLQARRQGLESILDGFDGDTTISHGVVYLAELARAGRISTLWREVSALSRHNEIGRAGILWRRALKPLIPDGIRSLKARILMREHRSAAIVPAADFARRSGYHERLAEHRAINLAAVTTERAHHYRRLHSGHIDDVFETLDRAAGGIGIEPRYPFFDRRLVEFCLALPGSQKLQNGWRRFILRSALGGILPETIRWRPGKTNLGHNFIPAFLHHEAESLAAMVGSPEELSRYVDIGALSDAFERYRRNPSSADATILWKALLLDHWLRSRGESKPAGR
jgi:asparagine synthase (glutamine-hydrolysing)